MNRQERREKLTQAQRAALQKIQLQKHKDIEGGDVSKKLPRTFSDPKVMARISGSALMDLCYLPRRIAMGRYTEIFGGEYYAIDPFTDQTEKQLRAWAEWYHSEKPRLLLCTNVLNMYADNAEVVRKMDKLVKLAREGVGIAITIYEGDRSGICKETAVGKWQRNQPATDYARYMRQQIGVIKRNNVILIGL